MRAEAVESFRLPPFVGLGSSSLISSMNRPAWSLTESAKKILEVGTSSSLLPVFTTLYPLLVSFSARAAAAPFLLEPFKTSRVQSALFSA